MRRVEFQFIYNSPKHAMNNITDAVTNFYIAGVIILIALISLAIFTTGKENKK